MRLVTYEAEGRLRPGIWVGGSVVDAYAAGREAGIWSDDNHDGSPEDLLSSRRVLGLDKERLRTLEAAADGLVSRGADGASGVFAAEDVVLGPPVPDPEKIICLGLNYKEHAAEASLEAPAAPMLFAKFRNSLVGQGAPIVLPRASEKVDYEGELAVVIGRRCKEVAQDDALDYVAGYMPFNDVSARDLQLQTSQWMAGKAIDTFAPCGPALVSADEIEDVQALELRTRVNGETVQRTNTSMMIFSVRETIAFISKLMTLEPGDIIATGTPSGVGFKRNPPLLLGEGDIVEVEIEGLGVLHNPVVGPDGLRGGAESQSANVEQKQA
ncbi:MAG: Fumarylacetoacetate hydrolase family protein [uncultured Arthrobacter sp.]|uniref:Fumarylacetoacetate hydrolase family protein n=1 Tax=uncultured Arthrobacter sp. TaxID=114050 RepID=A0A6J4J8F2_9MICC|nr:fumarylacetoacetate hydrolase family protein [uncultured Arthrobacter sp.]CAA9273111.1 MAG: Fumarylacetoacetate hydrolase family protein [uncultured Arthrobacter sp.]